MPSTTEQNRIVRTGKFEVEVTNNLKKKLRSWYCTIEEMKLTTDRYEALCDLFVTAEPLVNKNKYKMSLNSSTLNSWQYLCQFLTDFQNSSSAGKRSKFARKHI